MSQRKAKEQLKLDQIMRILFRLSKKVTVHLINGLFEEQFNVRDVVVRYSNSEFAVDEYGRMAGDAFITIESGHTTITYHIEFQTLNDQSMVIRMFRYGFEKAVEAAQASGDFSGSANPLGKTVVAFPRQLVIFVEENDAIGDELSFLLRMPDGQEVEYSVPVMKYWTYSPESLMQRNLYALLPLQVFRLRKRMKAVADSRRPDEEKSRQLTACFEQLKRTIRSTLDTLDRLHDAQGIATGDLERILRVMHNITEYLYSRYGEYRDVDKEVVQMIKSWIDPKVLEEGRERGRQEGIQEGRQEGIQEGRQEGIQVGQREKAVDIARNLMRLGASREMIVQATGLSEEEVRALEPS